MKIKRFEHIITEDKIIEPVKAFSGEWTKGSTKWGGLIKTIMSFLLLIPNIAEYKGVSVPIKDFEDKTKISVSKLEEYLKDKDKKKLEFDISIDKSKGEISFDNLNKTKQIRYVWDTHKS